MKTVAIIPARGGSKRLPKKNIVDFLGLPIIAFTIKAAVDSGCFDRIVVSTEDEEIAVICERLGAFVDRRPSNLSTDTATLVEVCVDFLDREATAGRDWDVLACLYATAPLRNSEDIRGTIALVEPGRCGFAMAVTAYDHYPYQALKLAADSGLEPMWPELIDRRATDLPPLRAGNGSTYVVDVAEFRRHQTFYGPNLRGYDMPQTRSIDIDTQSDLDLALCVAQVNGLTGSTG
jgi:pseudaminic acid cytidylyltransferase